MPPPARAVRIGISALVAVPLLLSIGPAPLLAAVPIDGGPLAILPVAINATAGDQFDPHVDGDWASYTSDNNVRYYNFFTGADEEVPPATDAADYLSDVSNGRIAFHRDDPTGFSPELVYDISSGKPPGEVYPEDPSLQTQGAIGSDTVAFVDLVLAAEGELVVSRLGGATQRVTNDTRFDRHPAVAPSGDVVVFESCATSLGNCDVHQAAWNGSTWTASSLMDNADPEANPDTDGATVVYDAMRAGQRDICWQPVGGAGEQCLSLPGDQRNPSIASGVVLFEDVVIDGPGVNPAADLFAYQIATNRVFRITNTPVDESLNDISRLADGRYRIVWTSGTEPERDVYGATFALPAPPSPTFGGFSSPVDALPTLNSMKAGAAVPVKFSLGGDFGLSIFASGYPKSQVVTCDSTAPVDGVEVTVSAGGSSLQFDPTTGLYTYIWKTDKAWAGTCRQLVIGFADGSFARANFKFK